jgi:alpha-methylacyl-CoA racemase
MVDGAAYLGAAFHGFVSNGTWNPTRGSNIVDSGAPFYDVYETADGKWLTVAAMEAHFYADLLDVLGLDPAHLPAQLDQSQWPQTKKVIADAVRTRPRSRPDQTRPAAPAASSSRTATTAPSCPDSAAAGLTTRSPRTG